MMYLMIHTMAHLSPLWHIDAGASGWWAWFKAPYEQVGYGFAYGHYIAGYEIR